MTQLGQMVNFPGGNDSYEDSGEGGLFVVMVVPQPESWQDNCHVDVIAATRLSRPDVCVSPEGHELWEPWEHRKNDADKQSQAHQLLTEHGQPVLASWALRARNWDEFSVSMLAVIHVGSTSRSLWHAGRQEYWQAEYRDLNPLGARIHTGLHAAFGVEPLLLTFLDT